MEKNALQLYINLERTKQTQIIIKNSKLIHPDN